MKDFEYTVDVETLIHLIRGQRIMLSTDLAKLYQVAPKALVQAVKRNKERFPADFAFRYGRSLARPT